MCERAARSRRVDAIIPIYINLKEFRPSRSPVDGRTHVDADAVRAFVYSTVNKANNRDVADFLSKEFDAGITAGTWLFLFDSFDEIPDVLGATEGDETVKRYGEAIAEFLHSGFNTSRGVVASRQFRGPDFDRGWTTFRIAPLSEGRMADLVNKANMDSDAEGMMKAGLGTASASIKELADNPMFLGLLCDYVGEKREFPARPYVVYEQYMSKRFSRDSSLVLERYGLSTERLREIAEEAAFCIAAEDGLGLSPERSALKAALHSQGFSEGQDVDTALDALEFIKLARSEGEPEPGRSPGFTFAHRRFQEYFATSVALREPNRVNAHQLLTDGHWRETAVTICQTRLPDELRDLLDEAEALLGQATEQVGDDLDGASVLDELRFGSKVSGSFNWPPGALHLLGLLDAGFASRDPKLLDSLRAKAGKLLVAACLRGLDHDRKWALEVAGTAPEPVLVWMIREAFRSRSSLLREVAYRQVGRLHGIPSDIAAIIRHALLTSSVGGRLRRDHVAVDAQLQGLPQPEPFRRAKDLLLFIPGVDLLLHLGLLVVFLLLSAADWSGRPVERRTAILLLIFLLLLSHLSMYAMRASPIFSWIPNGFKVTSLGTGASTLEWLMIWYAIFGVQIAVIGATVAPTTLGSVSWIVGLGGSLYVVTWALGALIAVRAGRFTRVQWWPVIQIVMVDRTVAFLVRMACEFASMVKRRQIRGLMILLAYVILLGAYIFFLINFPKWIDFSRTPPTISENLPVLVLAIFVLGILVAAFKPISDWVWLRRWRHAGYSVLGGEELLNSINSLRTSGALVKLISIIRARGILDGTPNSLAVIEDLSLIILYASQDRKNTRGIKASEPSWRSDLSFKSSNFPNWVERYLEKHKWAMLATLRTDFNDELTKILEESRGKATKSASVAAARAGPRQSAGLSSSS
jgi:hypothetical protein